MGFGPAFLCVLCGFVVGSAADSALTAPALRVVGGGPVAVSARLLPRRGKALTVGDRFNVELVVRHPRDLTVSEPFLPDPGPFLVTDHKSVTRYEGDVLVDVHRLEMAAFAPGEVKVPPFLVRYASGTEVVAAGSDSLPLKIASAMKKDMKDLNDLKPQVQFPNLLPLWILVGLLAAAGLGYLGLRLYRRFRRIRLYGAPLPDPWTEALGALAAIPVAEWLDAGQVKRYYYTASEILKRYLERRFEFPAREQTSTEIFREMKVRKVPERDGFGDFFRGADMVKYAKVVPPRPEMELVVVAACGLVRATTPEAGIRPGASGVERTA